MILIKKQKDWQSDLSCTDEWSWL